MTLTTTTERKDSPNASASAGMPGDISTDAKQTSDRNQGAPSKLPLRRSGTKRKENLAQFSMRCLGEIWSFKFALGTFVLNSLRKRYQRSVLGFAWSLLNPLLTMVVLTMVFSLLFSREPKVYAAYLIAGLLPWSFMRDSIQLSSTSIVQGESYIKKVNLPKVFFPTVTVANEAINFLLSLVSLTLFSLCLGITYSATVLLVPAALLISGIFTAGLALTTAVATVYFRDLTHIISVILNSLFYFTPIFYSLDQVPVDFRPYFQLNPFYHFIELFRAIIHDGVVPSPESWAVTTGIAMFSLLTGLAVLKWRESDIIYRL